MNGANIKVFPCCGMFFGDNMNVASITNVHNKLYFDVASTIVNHICTPSATPWGARVAWKVMPLGS